MTIMLNYGFVFGKCDGSDIFEWEVELNEQQEAAYKRAMMTGASFEDFPELEALCEDVTPEIEEQELENFIDAGDEYTLECLGEIEVDPDEINQLVHERDEHAIEFFGLSELTDEELENWDANDLDQLPLVKDFEEDFEPESPFEGYILNVWIPEIEEYPEDDEIECYLEEALSAGDVPLAEAIVKGQADAYSDDIEETAFRIAKEVGCKEYIRRHKLSVSPED